MCSRINASLWLLFFSFPVVWYFPSSHGFVLLSFSVCRIPCRIFCSGGLVVIYYFSFCLSWKTFIAPSILNYSFAWKSILGLKLFSFSAQNTSLYALLAFNISVEKSAVIMMVLPLYVICCSLTAFNILSLLSVLLF
jgi:hypothetical protein